MTASDLALKMGRFVIWVEAAIADLSACSPHDLDLLAGILQGQNHSETEAGEGFLNFERESFLHIHAQYEQHDDVVIRGSRGGLIALRDALSLAIGSAGSEAQAVTNDGEGFTVKIERVNLSTSLGRLPYIAQKVWDLVRAESKLRQQWLSRPRNKKLGP